MHIKKILLILLLLYYSVSLAQAGTTLSPDSGHSNQKQINDALKDGNVYLEPGVYEVDAPIYLKSDRVLSGDPGAIIRVWPGSSQWFTGSTGVITGSGVSNIEISGFQIDGNIGNLPQKYHQSRSDTAHDCEKLIQIYGSSNNFVENIEICDMKFYNSFSDAVYVRFADGVSCHDNVISNCQHEGIYYSVVKNGLIQNNKIAGITSDCARLDNCQDCLIENNLFYSYEGDSYGFYKNGHSGLQIGDAGASKGYNGVKSKWHTSNIEVRFNTFADPGLRAIWLDAAGQKPSDNIYIHDNEFLDAAPVEIDGEPVSWDNQPSIEDSEEVFDSIFDFLNVDAYTQVGANTTVVLPEHMDESSLKAHGTITYYTLGNNTTTIIYIPKTALNGVSEVVYDINGERETHTLMIGEKTIHGIVFTETSIWDGEFIHIGDSLHVPGNVSADQIKITCVTPTGKFTPSMSVSSETFKPNKFHPAAILIVISFIIAYLFFRLSVKHLA